MLHVTWCCVCFFLACLTWLRYVVRCVHVTCVVGTRFHVCVCVLVSPTKTMWRTTWKFDQNHNAKPVSHLLPQKGDKPRTHVLWGLQLLLSTVRTGGSIGGYPIKRHCMLSYLPLVHAFAAMVPFFSVFVHVKSEMPWKISCRVPLVKDGLIVFLSVYSFSCYSFLTWAYLRSFVFLLADSMFILWFCFLLLFSCESRIVCPYCFKHVYIYIYIYIVLFDIPCVPLKISWRLPVDPIVRMQLWRMPDSQSL